MRRWTTRAAVAVATAPVLTACESNEFTRLGMPPPITEQADRVLNLWVGSWIAALAVGALVWGLIVWSIIFYRKRSEELPPQVRYNLPIEVLYTVIPFIIVAVLFVYTVRDENAVTKITNQAGVVVDVRGFQWSWQFTYRNEGVQITGRPEQDPQLVLPAGEKVRFNLTSPDVIHSFWVPEFLFKQDVIPGHPNHFEIDIKPDQRGTYKGRCAELCGVYHSQMLFTVKIVSRAEFDQFIAAQKAAGGVQ